MCVLGLKIALFGEKRQKDHENHFKRISSILDIECSTHDTVWDCESVRDLGFWSIFSALVTRAQLLLLEELRSSIILLIMIDDTWTYLHFFQYINNKGIHALSDPVPSRLYQYRLGALYWLSTTKFQPLHCCPIMTQYTASSSRNAQLSQLDLICISLS